MKYEFLTKLIHGVILLGCAFLFGYVQKNLFLLALSYLSVTFIVFFVFLLFFIKKYGISICFRPLILKKELVMLNEAKYLFFTQVCTGILLGADIWIISFILGLRAVAIYKNAVMITCSLYMFPIVIMEAIYPRLVQYRFKSAAFWNEMRKILKKTVAFGACVAAILFFLAPFLITFFFGEKYATSVPLFRVSLLSFLFVCIDQVFGYGIRATGEYKLYFLIIFVVSVFSVLLNLVLIPSIGLMGGVVTMSISRFLLATLPLVALGYRRECAGS
jgi:O-antigen/teichoic acid export membrane protein